MALTEQIVIGSIEILEDGQIQIRQDTVILDDNGNELTRLYFRYVLSPGDDTSALYKRIQDHANVEWTPAVVNAFKVKKSKQLKPGS